MKVIQNIINDINYTIEIKSIAGNTIEVCNSLYLNTSNSIFGKQIIEIEESIITLNNTTGLEVGQTETLPKLTFVRGNYRDGRNEIAMMQQEEIETYPIAFLYENPLKETWSRNVLNREAEIKLLLLNRSSFEYPTTVIKWRTEDHYNECIIPMKKIAERIYSYINDSGKYKINGNVTIENLKDFGIYKESDNEKALIEYNLSGCSMQFNLLFNEKNCC